MVCCPSPILSEEGVFKLVSAPQMRARAPVLRAVTLQVHRPFEKQLGRGAKAIREFENTSKSTLSDVLFFVS